MGQINFYVREFTSIKGLMNFINLNQIPQNHVCSINAVNREKTEDDLLNDYFYYHIVYFYHDVELPYDLYPYLFSDRKDLINEIMAKFRSEAINSRDWVFPVNKENDTKVKRDLFELIKKINAPIGRRSFL